VNRIKTSALILAFGLSSVLTGFSAYVVWQTPATITANTNVSTAGTLVSAYNIGGTAVTLNGVTFAAGTFTGPSGSLTFGNLAVGSTGYYPYNAGSALPAFTSLSAGYKQLIQTSLYQGYGTVALTLTGLTPGNDYQVQFWINRSDYAGSKTKFIAGNTSGDVVANVGTNGVGQFVIGTFTANATTQHITADNSPGNYYFFLSAYQLRDTTGLFVGGGGNLLWDPAGTNGASDGSGTWDLSAPTWWNSNNTAVTSWTNGSSAIFGNGGAAGIVSVGTTMTVSNITFNPTTNSSSLTSPFGGRPSVAYLANWESETSYLYNTNQAAFLFSNITHLVYIGAWTVDTNAALVIVDDASSLSNVVAITHAYGRKVLFTVHDGNGSTDPNSKLIAICASATKRATLITNILQYCQQNHLDGVDFDWEFPPESAVPDFVTFLSELRAAAPPGFLISAAVMYGTEAQALMPVDWFYLMAYTFDLSQCAAMLNGWVNVGTPPSKLVLGLGLFGVSPTNSYDAIGYASLIGTNTIDPSLDYYNGYKFTGINTVTQLTEYVYDNGFGGMGWFRVSIDTSDSRSLMLAGATQARASATKLGLGDGYLVQDGAFRLLSGTTFTVNQNATINSLIAGNNGWTKAGSATLVLGGKNNFSGGKNINAGTVRIANGQAFGHNGYGVYVAATATLELAGRATYDFNLSGGLAGTLRSTVSGAVISATSYTNQQLVAGAKIDVIPGATLLIQDPLGGSNSGFTKTGAGTLTLGGSNTYTGQTTVSNGTLLVNGSLAAGSPVTVTAGAALGGTGRVNGSLILNGTIAPGNGTGAVILATGPETWNGGGSYICEISSTNSAGADRLDVTGTLNVQATPGNQFTVRLASLDSSNAPGPLAGFNPLADYLWTIATASAVQNFAADKFVLDTAGFSNAFMGTFSLANMGTNLVLAYNPAPPLVALSSPSSGQNFVAPAAVLLTASVTTNGHAISQVQYYTNGVFAASSSAGGNYNASLSGVAAGAYSVTAAVVYESGSITSQPPASVFVMGPLNITSNVRMANGSFQLSFTGPAGQPFRVLGTNVLNAPLSTWPVLSNGTIGGSGTAIFIDSDAATKEQQFYRIISP
jgi:autotransporter-associated beta strand protein